ncbi:MAG: SpoIID/LytB domain-containing protein [Bdellovibrio sp.]|nr:SpoIID/LytB domain-containing protein [Bdellovibrio sp.]
MVQIFPWMEATLTRFQFLQCLVWGISLGLGPWAAKDAFGASRPITLVPENHVNAVRTMLKKRNAIRVLIGSGLKEVMIKGRDIERKIFVKNERKYFAGRTSLAFNCSGLAKLKNQKLNLNAGPILFASLQSPQGYFSYQNELYRGQIKVLAKRDEDACDVVNEIPIENYLQTLLAKEMNGNWPLEALKAQAVAARTYAIHKMSDQQVSRAIGHEAFYDLESSEKHQVSGGLADITVLTKQASKQTAGEILVTSSDTIVPIFFHAKCGGRTLLPQEVWDNVVEGYHSVECGKCDGKGEKEWKNVISLQRFRDFLKWAFKDDPGGANLIELLNTEKLIFVPDRIENKRIKVYVGEKLFMVSKTLLRRYFGRILVASNNFSLKIGQSDLSIIGKGLGHGVGLCQLGVLAWAQQGMDYRAILKHYFPGFRIEKAY